jgi:peptide-methionine (S)-S-oxide reductase
MNWRKLGLTTRIPLAIAGAIAVFTIAAPGAAEKAVPIPIPRLDPAQTSPQAVAVLAGGCFWGMEAVFEQIKGVKSVVSGYAGGKAADANYDSVSTETTGHAEAIRITYDPKVISYGTLLQVYFSAAHNPTQLNRQGPDSGPSYRSAVFPQTPDQVRITRAYIAQLSAAKAYPKPIVTKIESGAFYPAEAYHQDFFARNPYHPYILQWDKPKVAGFKAAFPKLLR